MEQQDLFGLVDEVYRRHGAVDNPTLYRLMEDEAGPLFGCKNHQGVDILKRKVRWYQQTLKHAGVLTRDSDGVWHHNSRGLTEIDSTYAVLGFSTRLGIAVIADCKHFFGRFDEPVHLVVTSPPYPLANPRRYGNVSEKEYVDWLCTTIEPLIGCMADGASLCLNVGNDIFLSRSPARSLYRERLVLALAERFGLYKMDELVWHNPNKPPSPAQWASLKRVQLNAGWEPVYWFTNNPDKVKSDNRAVLQAHTPKHLRFMLEGGNRHHRVSSDGSHVKKAGAYSNITAGRIPRNILTFPHDNKPKHMQALKEAGLPRHGATMPLALAEFLIRFLSRSGDLVADPFAGSLTTALAAEKNGRRWVATEKIREYMDGAALRFSLT